jgi:predicted nucleic acid-binding protein
MAKILYLADSNILLRLVQRGHPEHALVREALNRLRMRGVGFAYTLQNMTEFWNSSTRPVERNGFGMSIEQTESNAMLIERTFSLIPDNEAVYREWRQLVLEHRVSGTKVHDARLVASMCAHNLLHILTLNDSDFKRYDNVIAINPKDV